MIKVTAVHTAGLRVALKKIGSNSYWDFNASAWNTYAGVSDANRSEPMVEQDFGDGYELSIDLGTDDSGDVSIIFLETSTGPEIGRVNVYIRDGVVVQKSKVVVESIDNNVITAASLATDAVAEIQSGLSNFDHTTNSVNVGSVSSNAITAAAIASDAITEIQNGISTFDHTTDGVNVGSVSSNAITAAAIASDAITEIQNGLSTFDHTTDGVKLSPTGRAELVTEDTGESVAAAGSVAKLSQGATSAAYWTLVYAARKAAIESYSVIVFLDDDIVDPEDITDPTISIVSSGGDTVHSAEEMTFAEDSLILQFATSDSSKFLTARMPYTATIAFTHNSEEIVINSVVIRR